MSNKGLTFVIFILVLLCVATFGAFYLKINPQLAISQKIFGGGASTTNKVADNTNSANPFTENKTIDTPVVENQAPVDSANSFTENGVTVSGQSDTIIPNNSTTVSTDTSNATVTNTPTVPEKTGPITMVLKKGSKNSQVKILQQFLIDNKYLTGKADGSFGAMTETAVKKFQLENKINVDGVVDGKTRDALNSLLN
jgi:murein L,D-transpeptidase YcbB/YkuD